jgi:hypothetical protein
MIVENARDKIANIIHHTRLAGFADPDSEDSRKSGEWLAFQLTTNPGLLHVLAASSYCGMMQATLALPEYQEN